MLQFSHAFPETRERGNGEEKRKKRKRKEKKSLSPFAVLVDECDGKEKAIERKKSFSCNL